MKNIVTLTAIMTALLTSMTHASEPDEEHHIRSQGDYNEVWLEQVDLCNPDTNHHQFQEENLYEKKCEWRDVCPTCFRGETESGEADMKHYVCRDVLVGKKRHYPFSTYYQHFNPETLIAQEIYAFKPTFYIRNNGQCTFSVSGSRHTATDPQRGLFSMETVGSYWSETRGPKAKFDVKVKIPQGKYLDIALKRQYFDSTQWNTVATTRLYGNNTFQSTDLSHQTPESQEAWFQVVITSPNATATDIIFKYALLKAENCIPTVGGCLDH